MELMDRFRGLLQRTGRLGVELGREVAAVQLKGDPPTVTAAGHSAHAGYSGIELGSWLRRWFDTIDVTAKSARLVVVEGEVYHYLVTMPQMSDRERHLAAGAELRKLAPVPAAQLAYSHQAVGTVQEHGVSKQKVLIAAIDKTTLRNAFDTATAAGLHVQSVSTVPAALVKAAELLPSASGGQAIAYLAAGRSYLVVLQNGVVELVRDFVLRSDDRDFDPAQAAELIGGELRRSFLYFGQRAQGASVRKLVLAGPMSNLVDLAARLRQSLGITVEPFDASTRARFDDQVDELDQPALAVALGAAMLTGTGVANLVSPEELTESRVRQFLSVGRIAAAAVLALLIGWGIWALLDASWHSRTLGQLEQRLAQRRQELEQARQVAQNRADHAARQALLERRTLESTLLGALLQHVGQRIPDQVVLQTITWTRSDGPQGQAYWDAQLDGMVLGKTRSESQAIFNRFHSLLQADPIVHDVHLVEPLVIGTEQARVPPPLTAAVQERLGGGAGRQRPATGQRRPARPGETHIRTSLDDLPPFAPTETSVGFKLAVQLRGIQGGTP